MTKSNWPFKLPKLIFLKRLLLQTNQQTYFAADADNAAEKMSDGRQNSGKYGKNYEYNSVNNNLSYISIDLMYSYAYFCVFEHENFIHISS